MKKRSVIAATGGVSLLAALLLALTVGGTAGAAPAQKGKNVEFLVKAVEFKGSTTTDKLVVPPKNPKDLSDGYGYKAPGEADPAAPTKWEVSAYAFAPAHLVAFKGDRVTLRLFVVNGDEHKDWIEAPNGTEVFKERIHSRGREYVLTFRASQVGTYTLICNNHEPTMKLYVTVLPRGVLGLA